MPIGENIKKIRLKKELTQVELAKKVNVTQGMIARIERGSKDPSISLCIDIAKVLECKLEDLLKEVG